MTSDRASNASVSPAMQNAVPEEPGSVVPAVLVSVLILCIVIALLGFCGLLLRLAR
jgi:hypothetical protein